VSPAQKPLTGRSSLLVMSPSSVRQTSSSLSQKQRRPAAPHEPVSPHAHIITSELYTTNTITMNTITVHAGCTRPRRVRLATASFMESPRLSNYHIDEVKAKFHYAIQLASRSQTSSRAGRRPAANPSATRFELSRHVEMARTCLRQVGNQVCDQLAAC